MRLRRFHQVSPSLSTAANIERRKSNELFQKKRLKGHTRLTPPVAFSADGLAPESVQFLENG